MILRTILLAALALAPFAGAQAKWTQLSPATSPSPRAALSAASSFTGLYVFGGGLGAGKFSDELWRFDGRSWTNLTPATGNPPGRSNHGMAYDQARGRVVLFGGEDSSNKAMADLWEFDGVKWTRMTPATGPSGRRAMAMAYDVDRKVVVMHGGEASGKWFDETWEWDGGKWTLVNTTNKPSARGRHQMVYDAKRKRMVTFGGAGPVWLTPNSDKQTWTYDGKDWTAITTKDVPKGKGVTSTGLLVCGMAYDRLRDIVVLTAGYANQTYQSDTWEFDGQNWTNRGTPAGLDVRGGPAVGFVLGSGKTVMFGGFNGTSKQRNDTWDYQTDKLGRFTLGGTACKGSAGIPEIASDNLPWIGTSLRTSVSPVPNAAPVFMVLGASKTALPLDVIGATGCTSYASLDLVLSASTSGSTASLDIPIPASASLVGQQFFLQGIVRDGAANGLGLIFTARGEALLGDL